MRLLSSAPQAPLFARPAAARWAVVLCLVTASPLAAQGKKNGAAPAPVVPVDSQVLQRPQRANWFADGRAGFRVGEILTVTLDESFLATAGTVQEAAQSRDRSLDASATLPATVAPTTGNPAAGVRTGDQAQSSTRGTASRTLGFDGVMAVRILAVDGSGSARIEGTRLLNVDRNVQTLRLTGWVRPQDVSRDGRLSSQRIANAQLTTDVQGPLGKPKKGLLGRVIGLFWP
jgi:flagellar L-ring protein precursor FlgH